MKRVSPYLLSGLLAGAGVLHFLRPEFYDGIVPPFLGAPRAWTYGSGLAELLVAATVALPRTRRKGAFAAALLFVAVFPANVYAAVEPGDLPRWAAIARLPLQVPLVLWAVQVARSSDRPVRQR